jgi:diadenosine tetraphosphate (Ap4A) HIT family hydrolase
MDELPDEHLAEILLLAKKIAKANGLSEYNILQVRHLKAMSFKLLTILAKNNGALAFQHVFHVHFHVIPKPNEKEGLRLSLESWPHRERTDEELATTLEKIHAKL